MDTTTGVVRFSVPPALDLEVTADFEFDVPVRFDTDHMAVTIETYQLHTQGQYTESFVAPQGAFPRS